MRKILPSRRLMVAAAWPVLMMPLVASELLCALASMQLRPTQSPNSEV